ncbi:MAG: RNA-binding domain-containing protein [Candidatus Woesearchaeota archaeon]
MKAAHKVVLTVFAKEDENIEKVKQALISLVPLDLEAEKIKIQQQTATGFEEKQIKIYKIILEKTRHANEFVKSLIRKLTKEQKELLLRQAESRLDEELFFYIRLDKTQLLEKNEYYITDSGDCFHIKI